MQYLKDEIKENIVSAALQEFKEKGYYGASMRSIAHSAGITSGNIYRYFISKEALFDYILDPVYQKVMKIGTQFEEGVVKSNINYHNFDSMELIRELYNDILEAFAQYGTEFLILLDKSEGTKYSGIKENEKALIYKILRDVFLPELAKQGKNIQDEFILHVIACALVDGIGDILNNCTDGAQVRGLVESFVKVMLHNIYQRI
ncbi:MAG: TetR/AcrR family transcriptional regulator [Eubacteriales bacterium]